MGAVDGAWVEGLPVPGRMLGFMSGKNQIFTQTDGHARLQV